MDADAHRILRRHHHFVEHVVDHVLVKPPTGGFFVAPTHNVAPIQPTADKDPR
jgi:hypothetical protein